MIIEELESVVAPSAEGAAGLIGIGVGILIAVAVCSS